MMTGVWNSNTKNQRFTMDGYISIVIGEMEESETDSVDTLVLESGLEEPH